MPTDLIEKYDLQPEIFSFDVLATMVKSNLYQDSFVPKWKVGLKCSKIFQIGLWLVEL